MKYDMISGNPSRALIAFAVPMMLGQLFQNFYVIIDLLIVGRFVGQDALAAVGSTTTICLIFVNIAIGLSLGCSVAISQLFGAEKYPKLRNAINTSVVLLFALSIVFMVLALVIGGWVLQVTNTPESLIKDAGNYYNIYVIGFPGLYIFNIANSSFNSLGKSKPPLAFLIGSSLLNVVLDLIFIIPLKMGVAGAAWATTIAQYLSAIVSVIFLYRYVRKKSIVNEKIRLFDSSLIGKMMKVALPSCIQQSIMSFGNVFMQSLVNSFGPAVMAGYATALKVDSIAIIPLGQMANALANFTGQNIGANNIDRVKKGLKTGMMLDAAIAVAVAAILIPLSKSIVGLFMTGAAGNAAVEYGATYMIINSSFYFVMGAISGFAGVLRGAGDANWSMLSLLGNFMSRVIIANILVLITGSALGICWGPPIGWTVGAIIAIIRYSTGKWKTKALFKKGAVE